MYDVLRQHCLPVIGDGAVKEPYVAGVAAESAVLSMVEARQLELYIEYICRTVYQRSRDEVVKRWSDRAAPYAAVPGHNTVTFLKRSYGDWAFRRALDPEYRPRALSGERLGLPQLLDRVATLEGLLEGTAWAAWKAEHELLQVPGVDRPRRMARRRVDG